MKQLLGPYLWQFVLVYIDDIIIYSQTLEQHVHHLDQVLTLLENSDVTLALSKCHFAYPSIKALGHHVSWLGLSIIKKKINAIKAMKFSRNLRDLEVGLGFFGYYRWFVDHYAAIARPLVRLKIKDFIDSSMKGRSRREHATRLRLRQQYENNRDDKSTNTTLDADEECRQAWEALKSALC